MGGAGGLETAAAQPFSNILRAASSQVERPAVSALPALSPPRPAPPAPRPARDSLEDRVRIAMFNVLQVLQLCELYHICDVALFLC